MSRLDDKEVARRIAEERKKRRLTQEGLARAVGKSAQMGGKWERAENMPAPETRLALAAILRVDPEYLGYELPATFERMDDAPPSWFSDAMAAQGETLAQVLEQLANVQQEVEALRDALEPPQQRRKAPK